MRAVTPEDLKLVAPSGAEPDISTITISAPRTNIPSVPWTPFITMPPPPAPPPGLNPLCMPPAPRANQQLTKENEALPNSPALTTGVVPGNPGTSAFSNSGVTVSYGFDLAQHFPTDLVGAGLNRSVIDQLRPFLAELVTLRSGGFTSVITRKGPRGQQAQDLLDVYKIDPPLSSADVQNLFEFSYGRAFNSAVNGFQSLVGGNSNFFTLPAAAQSVLTDLTYQHGSLTSSKFPSDMQNAIATQNWATLANLLQKQGMRGANDASVLRAAIQAGELATSGVCR